jgi:hypothetical protein
MNDPQESDMLEWTFSPKVELVKDGSVKCFISTPQPAATKTRQKSLHILREFEMMPARTGNPKPPRSTPNQALEIRVHETDLRRYENKPELLSRCALAPMQEDAGQNGADKTRSRHSLYHVARPKRRAASTTLTGREGAGMDMPVDDYKPRYEPLRLPKRSSSCPWLGKQTSQKEPLSGKAALAKERCKANKTDGHSRRPSTASRKGNAKSTSLPTLFSMLH